METDSAVAKIDELLKEYLAFRGFTATLKQFEVERKSDKTKAHQTEKIVEQIFTHLQTFEYTKFFEYWGFLKSRFFSRLDSKYFETVKKLENSLKKYYVIRCIQSNRKDKCKEFFEKNSEELSKDREWRDWFVIPFLNNPELHPELEPYMNKRWEEMLSISMHNFISTVIISIEKPELLTIFSELSQGKSSLHKKKMDSLQNQNEALKRDLNSSENNIKKLRKKIEMKQQESSILKCKPIQTKFTMTGHLNTITSCFMYDGRLVTASKDNTIKLWNVAKGEVPIASYNCGAEIVCLNVFEKKGMDLFLCALSNHRIKMLFLDSGVFYEKGDVLLEEGTSIMSISSHNARCIVSTVFQSISSLSFLNTNEFKLEGSFLQDTFPIVSTSMNHNGSILLTANSAGFIKVIDLNTKELIMDWKGHSGRVTQVMYSGDETTLYTIGDDCIINQWSAYVKGRCLQSYKTGVQFAENTTILPQIALSPGEKLICLSSPSSVFEVDNAEPSYIFLDNAKETIATFNCMTFNEKGDTLIVALDTHDIAVFTLND